MGSSHAGLIFKIFHIHGGPGLTEQNRHQTESWSRALEAVYCVRGTPLVGGSWEAWRGPWGTGQGPWRNRGIQRVFQHSISPTAALGPRGYLSCVPPGTAGKQEYFSEVVQVFT